MLASCATVSYTLWRADKGCLPVGLPTAGRGPPAGAAMQAALVRGGGARGGGGPELGVGDVPVLHSKAPQAH